MESLRARLDALDTQPRKSALAALAIGISSGSRSRKGISALEFLAIQYRQRIAAEGPGGAKALQAEIRRTKNHVWRLAVSLGTLQDMPEFLALVSDELGNAPRQQGALHEWFPSLGKGPDGMWVLEDQPARLQELDELAQLFNRLSERISRSGKSRPGRRPPPG